MSINWNNIRAIDGQREGFEELICQLAGQEKIDTQEEFFRIGKPDGGKECYWKLENDKIHCWQAKYFVNSLSDSQWSQVDKSVKTTIDNHPTLETYYISIPVDRPDGKTQGKSMLQKWKDYVVNWEKYASSKKMKVSFEYWGKHELEIRLRKKENEGLLQYFFNEAEFTNHWFNSKNQDSIDTLGGRYTPQLNFKLPFLSFLSGLERNEKFESQMNTHYRKILKKHRRLNIGTKLEELQHDIIALNNAISDLQEAYKIIPLKGVNIIPFEHIKKNLSVIIVVIDAINDKLLVLREEQEKIHEEASEKYDHHSRPFGKELDELTDIKNVLYDFNDFIDSPFCALANKPYVILTGAAGIGKSHALADIVEERNRNGKISLLLLGENFSTNEMPWTQILRNQLLTNDNEDVFLGALNAKAQSQQNRIILIIDALNEGNGRRVWPQKLKAFIRSFHRYPWLGLIVSIRNSFENLIAPENQISASDASRIRHTGFEGMEYEASIHFFNHYNIIPPGSPLLNPEFQNPLFLKLFCEGLAKKGLSRVPEGYQGISTIIEYYLDGIEHKLSQPDQLDYDIRLKLLRKAVDQILVKMIEEKGDHLSYEVGEEITSGVFSNKCSSDDRQYLKRLISEGVINEDLYWKKSKSYEGIHFAYQRFQDHLIVSSMLDKYLDTNNPEKSFKSGPLKELLKNEWEAYYNQNIIEALSIQLPERIGKELHQVAHYAIHYHNVALGFIDSLVWRKANTIGESSCKFVNEVLKKDSYLHSRFWNAAISLSAKPDFYFNADMLHKTLYEYSMAERDSWWTIWLHDKYGNYSDQNSVKRLINWAWSNNKKESVDNESTRLAAVMLGWFLTSSNRYLRDAATKALVCLLQDRIQVLIKVLQQFEGINDPYIYERLYCVAYGCALRTTDKHSLVDLSEYIYATIFEPNNVYPHILLRDYARGVLEYSDYLKLIPKLDIERARPPYTSQLPKKLPTITETDEKYAPKGEDGHYGRKHWGSTAILRSMTTEYGRGTTRYGDFGRYTFQSALKHWKVDYDGLSNHVVERIFEMGYNPEIFSDFDSQQGTGRDGSHKERIGKKYQWIAFYEILAKVADNCLLLDGSRWSEKDQYMDYDGPWNPYVRDIDPTITLNTTQQENNWMKSDELPWWLPRFDSWQGDFEHWKRNADDFPSIEELLTVKDERGNEWLNLHMHSIWQPPKSGNDENSNETQKRIWYDIGSYLMEAKELNRVLKIENTNNIRNWIPEISNRYEVFSREYHWSPASSFFQKKQYFGGDSLPIELIDQKTGKTVASAYRTVIYYLWEEEYDCSKEGALAFYKPSAPISFGMNATREDGKYMNDKEDIVCFDPSVYKKGPTCLLIKKDHMLKVLKESGLKLVWVIQGEKQILTNNYAKMPKFDHKIGGLYYLGEEGNPTGKMESYINNHKH